MIQTAGRQATPLVWAAAAGLLVLLPNFSASPVADDYDSQRLLELAVCTGLIVAVTAVPTVRAAWLAVWARVPAGRRDAGRPGVDR